MQYTLRLFRDDDAPILAQLTLAAIKSVGSQRYTPDQVAVWASRHPGPERFLARARAGAWICVAVGDDDVAVAYTLLEAASDDAGDVAKHNAGHLDMLYCHPDHTRKGLAERLLDSADQYARSAGMVRLFTEASELARPAFERAGYVVDHRQDFEISYGEMTVAIHNYAMDKKLG